MAGEHALGPQERAALDLWSARRTFTRDVNAMLLDLLSVFEARPTFPYASQLLGRSLLRPPGADEPVVPLSTQTGVWEPDFVRYGVMRGDMLVVSGPRMQWRCFDAHADPTERHTVNDLRCLGLIYSASRTFSSMGATP